MKQWLLLIFLGAGLLSGTLRAESAVREGTAPFRVCVLDFSSADIKGDKLLDNTYRAIEIPTRCTLTGSDRISVNPVMQGYVRMIDAESTADSDRAQTWNIIQDSKFNRERALKLYRAVVESPARPLLIGADELAARLAGYSDVFSLADSSAVLSAMDELRKEPSFPEGVLPKLAKASGADLLVCGTVSDLRTRKISFRGYGIETEESEFQLDLIVRVVNLRGGRSFGTVCTGTVRMKKPVSGTIVDDGVYQKALSDAIAQAASKIYTACRPGFFSAAPAR